MAIHTNSLLQGDGIKPSPLMCISYNCAKRKPLRRRLMERPALHVAGTARCFYGKVLNARGISRQGENSWRVRTSHLIFPPQKFLMKISKSSSATRGEFIFIPLPFPLMNELQTRHAREALGKNMHPIIESFPIS